MQADDSELHGVPVRAASGERIGEVQRVLVDPKSGKPASIEVAADVAQNAALVLAPAEVEVTEDGIFLVPDMCAEDPPTA